jgi:superfamily II DNA/RNA helicase
VDAKKKIAMLEQLLPDTEPGSVLVFTRTKHRAKSLALKLSKMGHTATSLQGNLSQNKRQQALDGFKKGKFRIMVATDIAARGIDCASVTHVINYDVPDTAENYTHRIGRTGRAERTGEALTLVSPDEASTMRMIERVLKTSIERKALDGFECAEPVSDDRPPRRGNRPANGRGGRSGRPANAEGRSNGPRRSRSRTSESGAEGESRGQRRGPKSGGSRKPSRRPSASSGGESRQHPPKRKVGYQGSNKDKNKQPVVEVGRGEWADVFSPE